VSDSPTVPTPPGVVCPTCYRTFEEQEGRKACPFDGAVLVSADDVPPGPDDPMIGRVLAARFTILARIGAGSMGTVYRAKQAPIGRDVAVKILRGERAVDEVSRARFLREARANSLLTSPNTVTVFDFGQSETGDFYLAMELLEGESVGARIKRLGCIDIDEAIESAKQAARSLSEAHAKGIIHRDLKPDNLFYARVHSGERRDKPEEVLKVLDFGIAKMLHPDSALGMNAVETQEGTVFGTPRYMSPEQAQGRSLDPRSDLYSLGVILYHMLTGRPPFTDDDAIVVMARHIKTAPRPLRDAAPDANIPPELDALVLRLLSKEPDGRPENADALIAELARVKEAVTVSSGVRASVSNFARASSDAPKIKSVTPMALSPQGPADTLSALPVELRPRSRRWLMAGGAAVALAFVGVVLFANSPPAHHASSTSATPVVSTTAPPPAVPAASAPATVTTSAIAPASAAAPSSTIPTIAATALPRATDAPHTEKPAARPSKQGTSQPHKAAAKPGYGYLE
jgi:serine/threonine-protein kinase